MGTVAKINFKAVAIGLAAFSIPYLAIVLVGDAYTMGKPAASLFLYQFFFLILGGYVAGRLSEQNALVNGALTGVFAPVAIGIGYAMNMLQPALIPETLMSNSPLWFLQSLAGSSAGAFFSPFGGKEG